MLRAMPAKKAVAAGAAAALVTGAVPVAAGIIATGVGAGWVRRNAHAAPAQETVEDVEEIGPEEEPPLVVEVPVQAGAARMERVDELVARVGGPAGMSAPAQAPVPEHGDELAVQALECM